MVSEAIRMPVVSLCRPMSGGYRLATGTSVSSRPGPDVNRHRQIGCDTCGGNERHHSPQTAVRQAAPAKQHRRIEDRERARSAESVEQ